MRQGGAVYLDILAAGGGILSTVAATRAAGEADLLAHGRRWLDEMLGHGVTTIEAKSGYGLDLETELRLVEVAYRLGREGPIDVVPTWLGAHAVPPEFRARPDGTEAYVRSLLEEQLPGDRRPRPGAVRRCVLRERRLHAPTSRGGCSRRLAATGWRPRLHADELAPSGGAELAAELGGGVRRPPRHAVRRGDRRAGRGRGRGRRPVVATLLPVTTWFLMKDHHAPARAFIDARRAGRDRHRLQPGHLARRRTCRSRCRSPA